MLSVLLRQQQDVKPCMGADLGCVGEKSGLGEIWGLEKLHELLNPRPR